MMLIYRMVQMNGARCRNRTYDLLHVKETFYL